MIPKFELHLPETAAQVCELLDRLEGEVLVVAGGTDVMVELHGGKLRPDHLVDLKQVAELREIRGDAASGLDMGAMVTHHEIETDPRILQDYPVLFQGVNTVGSLQVRSRGTIGGNICTAAPSADGIGPLLVLNARCTLLGTGGERSLPLAELFTGPRKTVLKKDEILTRIQIPAVSGKRGEAYYKYGRRKAMEIALMGMAVYLIPEEDGHTCREARIALATSAPVPIRVPGTETFLKGKDLADAAVLQEAGRLVLEEARPRSSWRSSAEFRRELLENLLPVTLRRAYESIR